MSLTLVNTDGSSKGIYFKDVVYMLSIFIRILAYYGSIYYGNSYHIIVSVVLPINYLIVWSELAPQISPSASVNAFKFRSSEMKCMDKILYNIFLISQKYISFIIVHPTMNMFPPGLFIFHVGKQFLCKHFVTLA